MEALTCQEDVDDGVNAVSDVNRYTWLVDIKRFQGLELRPQQRRRHEMA